jgi:hypothetical protein
MRVVALVDNQTGPPIASSNDVISISTRTYRQLGLFRPPEVGWRCGDYGLYVARRRFPGVENYWLLDDDLRIDGSVRDFFGFFSALDQYDFLATNIGRAEPAWYWTPHVAARDAVPYRCQFNIVRLSGRALDIMYQKRKAHSYILTRRINWPNDESFTATTVVNSGLKVADINSFGRTFYTSNSLRLTGPPQLLLGEDSEPMLTHPILRDRGDMPAGVGAAAVDRYTRKDSYFSRKLRAIAQRVNRSTKW